MERTNPEKKPAARSSSSKISSSKAFRQKKSCWQQGHTPLTTQLPSPAMEEDTPLATAGITSNVHERIYLALQEARLVLLRQQ